MLPFEFGIADTQASALRFSQDNVWLNDLDKDFINLKANKNLQIKGKELIEDLPLYGKGFIRKQIVEPFSGAKYFGNSFKVPGSDHCTIAAPADRDGVQHRLLVQFITEFAKEELSSIKKSHTSRQQFNSKLIELKLSYLIDKQQTLKKFLNLAEEGKDTSNDVRESIENWFKFHGEKLMACFELLPADEAEELRVEYRECCYLIGKTYEQGVRPTEDMSFRIVSFPAKVNNLLRKELIQTTKEIELTMN